MLTFILTAGSILLYFIIGALVAFPVRMFVWYLTFVFDGINAANKHSDRMFLLFVLIWPFVLLYLVYLLAVEGVKYAKQRIR